jgi:hypothetical protein
MKLIAPDPEMRVAMPYDYTAKPLLTPTEARFHACLVQITQDRCRIQIKPRLADVFEHEKGEWCLPDDLPKTLRDGSVLDSRNGWAESDSAGSAGVKSTWTS